MYVVANILTLYRMERLRMVQKGWKRYIYTSQKVNFMILFHRPVTSSAGIRNYSDAQKCHPNEVQSPR